MPMTGTMHLPMGSTAVMARRVESADSLDLFPTPPWATRALFEHALPSIGVERVGSVWEPACGLGHMSGPIAEYAESVQATDIFDYSGDDPARAPTGWAGVHDFRDLWTPPHIARPHWIITNPPFNLALTFALLGLERARVGVALLVRTTWLESRERYEQLFEPHPPALTAQFAERVPMVKGRWDPAASTATGYAWFVWTHRHGQPPAPWRMAIIPPGCRKNLNRADDQARYAPWSMEPEPAPLLDYAPSG